MFLDLKIVGIDFVLYIFLCSPHFISSGTVPIKALTDMSNPNAIQPFIEKNIRKTGYEKAVKEFLDEKRKSIQREQGQTQPIAAVASRSSHPTIHHHMTLRSKGRFNSPSVAASPSSHHNRTRISLWKFQKNIWRADKTFSVVKLNCCRRRQFIFSGRRSSWHASSEQKLIFVHLRDFHFFSARRRKANKHKKRVSPSKRTTTAINTFSLFSLRMNLFSSLRPCGSSR